MKTWAGVKIFKDEAGRVAKYVFTKSDAVAESVLYRYPDYRTRTVICCSTQSGCQVGCRFCGTGDYFVRSLTADEIVEQTVRLLEDVDVMPADMGRLQIMFMSMGEPLLNLRGLVPAIEELHRLYPKAALLISTSAPRVDIGPVVDVSVRVPTVGLQFSVHESTDEARDALIPFKGKMTLDEIAAAGERWYSEVGRRPFFNYCAHAGNTSAEDVARLRDLLDPLIWCATVSVICERTEGIQATNERQRNLATDFAGRLVGAGYDVRVFDPAGQDTVGGGCGQLHFVQRWFRENPAKVRGSVGYGLAEVHTPS